MCYIYGGRVLNSSNRAFVARDSIDIETNTVWPEHCLRQETDSHHAVLMPMFTLSLKCTYIFKQIV